MIIIIAIAVVVIAFGALAIFGQFDPLGRTSGNGEDAALSSNVSQNDPVLDEKLAEAFSAADSGDDYTAMSEIQILEGDGFVISESDGEKYQEISDRFYSDSVYEASSLIDKGDFAGANEIAKKLSQFFPDDARVKNLLFSSTNIVEYNGVVEHIFFHPLIAFPERAFPADGRDTGQDLYMATVPEFKEVIRQLYEKDYILININSLYTPKFDENGATIGITKNTLMLPEGKKPVILSVDDINYYTYMQRDGQVFKLFVGEDNKIYTWSIAPDGSELISRDNELVPILDDFVEEHPDFSMNFVKGTLGLTGYQGILGYRTDEPTWDGYEEEKAGALKLVARLKELGWNFASHSQGHRHTAQVSYEKIVDDTDRWAREVLPLIGQTSVYIYPYGESVPPEDPKFQYFQKAGFAIFCTVGMNPYLEFGDSYAVQTRRNIDGISLRGEHLKKLLDTEKILDPVRPKK